MLAITNVLSLSEDAKKDLSALRPCLPVISPKNNIFKVSCSIFLCFKQCKTNPTLLCDFSCSKLSYNSNFDLTWISHFILNTFCYVVREGFDCFIINFVGTNDYNAGVPVGEWFTEEKVTVNADGRMVERIRRIPVMDQNTYRGRINSVLDKLKRMYPTKQIVLLTPIHRAYARFADHNVQPDESHQNACGEYVDAYVASIKEASAIWSVPVIDTYALSGLFPMHQEQQMYFPGGNDWLHPDQDGHRRFALCLYYQLLTLPCRF